MTARATVRPGWWALARRRASLRPALIPLLVAMLAAAVVVSAGHGAVGIGAAQVVSVLCHHLGLPAPATFTAQEDAVLWTIRFPRVLLAIAVGSALAVSGATLQGVFRNPLADPGLIGVSSGGALGAVGSIVLGIAPLGVMSLPAAAFVGALAVSMVVYGLSRTGGRADVVTLILTGVAVNAICGSVIGYLTFSATDAQLRSIVFWSMGSLGAATWESVVPVVVLVVPGTLLLLRLAGPLNVLVLGERDAYYLGVSPERLRAFAILLVAMVTGAAVAVAGIVGFVGLVVPHLLRLIAGPDHRTLLPASALAGAILLLLTDLAARTLVVPRELPLGVVTGLVGGPYFLWLLHRSRGTWAP